MKLKIEINPDFSEEVIIRAPELSERVSKVQQAIKTALSKSKEIALRYDEQEVYIPYSALLFFEVENEKVFGHDCNKCYLCQLRLNELESILPTTFIRASKSLIVNTSKIRSMTRFPTGLAEATFDDTEKTVFISRKYYKTVRKIIEETRLNK